MTNRNEVTEINKVFVGCVERLLLSKEVTLICTDKKDKRCKINSGMMVCRIIRPDDPEEVYDTIGFMKPLREHFNVVKEVGLFSIMDIDGRMCPVLEDTVILWNGIQDLEWRRKMGLERGKDMNDLMVEKAIEERQKKMVEAHQEFLNRLDKYLKEKKVKFSRANDEACKDIKDLVVDVESIEDSSRQSYDYKVVSSDGREYYIPESACVTIL